MPTQILVVGFATMTRYQRSTAAPLLAWNLVMGVLLLPTDAWTLVDRLTGRTPWGMSALASDSYTTGTTCTRAHAFDRDDGHMTGSSSELRSSTKQDQQDMVQFMNTPMSNDHLHSFIDERGELVEMDADLLQLVYCIVRAADGRKADDIVALRVQHVSSLTSVLVILSGNSRPQNQAIAAAILQDVERQYQRRPGGSGVPEGSPESGWILLDYGNVMVHIMTPKSRLFYNVEGQWRQKGGVALDISHVVIPNTVGPSSEPARDVFWSESTPAPSAPPDSSDPFWS